MRLKDIQKQAFETAKEKGWHENPVSFLERIALIHSELSEAVEEFRHHKDVNELYYHETGKPEGIPTELADVIIRICELSEVHDIDLEEAVKIKLEWNKTRPYKHGGKKI